MDKPKLDLYLAIHEEIREAANQLLSEYCKIHGISAKYLSFDCVRGNELYFAGDEYWSYGGHEHHELELPLAYLYTDWQPIEKDKKKQQDARIEAAKQMAVVERERRELAELAKLKAKYEGQ